MISIIFLVLGIFAGAVSIFFLLEAKRRNLDTRKLKLDAREQYIKETIPTLKMQENELATLTAQFQEERENFRAKTITYKELADENSILKHDLQNIDVNLRKLELDNQLLSETQQKIDQECQALGTRHLKDNIKWIGSSLTSNNYANSKRQLLKTIGWCRQIGLEVSPQEEASLLADLQQEFERIVRAALEREEQARIKAQIREEQKLEKEIERELKDLERERTAIQAALEKALAETKDEHSAEIERLKARLAEAEEKSERAISRAQMTKSGHVYVISNIGSFGENVFKIGMTRRLEPMERVKELGDASVPFPFDVHMMISSDDAPTLENVLHRALHKLRLNKINPRKEFFRTDIESIRDLAVAHHGEINYVADAEALQYRQSLEMSEEDLEYVESVYDDAEAKKTIVEDED